MKKILVILTVFIALLPLDTGWAAERLGIHFDDYVFVRGTRLNLVGIGLKQRYFINLYLRALYLEHDVDNRLEAVYSDQKKTAILHFLYINSRPDQIRESWDDGFELMEPVKMQRLEQDRQRFLALFNESLMPGDRVKFVYIPGTGTEVYIKGERVGRFEKKEFMEVLLGMWFDRPDPGEDFWAEDSGGGSESAN